MVVNTENETKRLGKNEENVKDIDCKDSNPWCRYISKYECNDESVKMECEKTCGRCSGN